MEDLTIIDDYRGIPIIVCPHQFIECKHHFPYGDGAFYICTLDECYKTKKCIKDINQKS